jgi:hypothetical protein
MNHFLSGSVYNDMHELQTAAHQVYSAPCHRHTLLQAAWTGLVVVKEPCCSFDGRENNDVFEQEYNLDLDFWNVGGEE